jgi:hypothetical protein
MTEEKSAAPWDIDETAEQTIDLARGAMESYRLLSKDHVRFALGTNRLEQENSKLCR